MHERALGDGESDGEAERARLFFDAKTPISIKKVEEGRFGGPKRRNVLSARKQSRKKSERAGEGLNARTERTFGRPPKRSVGRVFSERHASRKPPPTEEKDFASFDPARVANGGGGVRDAETRRRARSSLACLRAARAR